MAFASFRVQLFTAIRDVLYTTNPSNGSAAPLIPSLDLIKIISRLAEPHEQLAVWQRSSLHALDVVASSETDARVRVGTVQLIARFEPRIELPPLAMDFCVGSGLVRSLGGMWYRFDRSE